MHNWCMVADSEGENLNLEKDAMPFQNDKSFENAHMR